MTTTYNVNTQKKTPLQRLLAIPELHASFSQFGEEYATAFLVNFASMAVHDYECQKVEGLATGRARDYFVQERARAIARLRQCDEILGREQTIPRRNR